MCVKKSQWNIDWSSDYIRKGARFNIKDKEGNIQGRLEFLSKPEIDFGDNNGYVTVKIRAGCIGSDGKPITNVKLEKKFESYASKIHVQIDLKCLEIIIYLFYLNIMECIIL